MVIIAAVLSAQQSSAAQEGRYITVLEESFYVVKPEHKARFLEVYRTRMFPFWNEMYAMGLTVDEFRLYSQRIHTLEPHWTFKSVVRFKNYQAIDRWLEIRYEVYERLFPGEGGYKAPRAVLDKLIETHWDEFIREVNMEGK